MRFAYDWMLSPLGRAMANGYGAAGDREAKTRFQQLAEALGGVDADPRHLAALTGLTAEVYDELVAALATGAREPVLRAIAGLPQR